MKLFVSILIVVGLIPIGLFSKPKVMMMGTWLHDEITRNGVCLEEKSRFVNDFDSLTQNDTTPDYLCGFHWELFKIESPAKFTSYLVNKDCNDWIVNSDLYNHFMKKCGGDSLKTPSHYLYDLKIPIEIAPQLFLDKYKSDSFQLLFLDSITHLPMLEYEVACTTLVQDKKYKEAKEKIDKKAREIIKEVNKKIEDRYKVKQILFENNSSGGGKGKQRTSFKVEIIFDYLQVIEDVKRQMVSPNIREIKMKTPRYYFLQVLFSSKAGEDKIKEIFPEVLSSNEHLRFKQYEYH